MGNRTQRAQRRRVGSSVRSVAQAEAALSDDVRRRLRATIRAPGGWVPTAPERALDGGSGEETGLESAKRSGRDESGWDGSGRDEPGRDGSGRDEPGREGPGWDGPGTDGSGPDEPAWEAIGDSDHVPTSPVRPSMGARLRGWLAVRLPVGLRGAEVAPSYAAVAGLAGLLAAALAVVLLLTWWQRPHESPVPSVRRSVPASAVAPLSTTATPTPTPRVVVQVTGAVRRPGLVQLPGGSRVDDAVSAVGGATRKADLSSVNLARLLVDGEQIVVLRKGQANAPAIATGPAPGGSASPAQPIDLNTATLEQLDGLPGVGPVLAQRILDFRTAHGRFSSVDELTDVSGIGERTLADIRALVHV